MIHFEFSNESYINAHSGQALAAQYAYALAQWAPQLKAILPNMKLGANGLSGYDSVGAQDRAQNTGVKWWSTVRASRIVPQACAHQPADNAYDCLAIQGSRSLLARVSNVRVLTPVSNDIQAINLLG